LNYAHFRLPSRSLQISKTMSADLIAMFKDFYAATNLGNVMIYATTNTPTALAYQVSIPERASGLTLDLAVWDEAQGTHSPFKPEGNYAWLQSHCAEYGFVQRFTADKSAQTGMQQQIWHYRYVGVPHAVYMTQENLCLEEYLTLLRESHDAGNPLLVTTSDASYTVYYVPAAEDGGMTEITVPKDLPITTAHDGITAEQNANLYQLLLNKLTLFPFREKYSTPVNTLAENAEKFAACRRTAALPPSGKAPALLCS